MSQTPPIACSLHPSDAPERETEIRALGRDGLRRVEHTERRATLRFDNAPAIRERVDRVVAAESVCCAFLEFAVTADLDEVVVTVTAPKGGEPIMAELVGLFAA